MMMLISGLVIWSIVHLLPSLAPKRKQQIIERRGETVYKLSFTICILAALALIIFGWRSTVPVFLYQAPVGLVHFGWCIDDQPAVCDGRVFEGDRNSVRQQTVLHALKGIISRIEA